MRETLVNLNVNPCNMCMPMGAVTALYGIKKCMTILHGSQGCSTYIRRHMATHYNEPVDIASSSMTEEGTVYGGEKNLIQGLMNLIKVYEPEVIGVATTCLAETIGEDIHRIIHSFYEQYPEYNHIIIIPVHSAGYGGSQFEGYLGALYQIVKNVPMKSEKNQKVNIITDHLSPADTRYLKMLLDIFTIDYILLPDISDNLDGGYEKKYNKLPQFGTDIRDIMKMAGARHTIELISFVGKENSVGEYLRDTYGVPYQRCNPPVSLRDNDILIRILAELSGKEVPELLIRERSRFLDAMIDAHKYNGEARAAVYGEPDFVYSTVRLCVENGIIPVIAATGTKGELFKELVSKEIMDAANQFFIERFEVLEEIDFQTIEELAGEMKVNLLIGNSDGRRMAERLKLDLVRRSFPIHDRMGGQRLRILGYEGALTYLDDISNAILGRKENGFREELYQRFYVQPNRTKNRNSVTLEEGGKYNTHSEEISVFELTQEKTRKSIEAKTATHPCFNCGAHKYARIHLPIAPKCNISCNYCVRKYDCPNESRPGVTTSVLSPEEAFQKYIEVKKKVANLSVVGIAGPGDALANFPETIKTLELIRKNDPDVTFCISTNGLMLPKYTARLIAAGVTHVTVTMNAVDPKIGAKIYRYVEYMGVKYYGEAAAAILLSNQMAGIKMLAEKGIPCKVNIVMIKGINDTHIPEVVDKVKELGGIITNIMPLIPVKGSAFEDLPLVSEEEIIKMRKKCGEIMKQMLHCRQCRADAIGTLNQDRSFEFNHCIRVAVATKSGTIVDQHFGHVDEFYIYEYRNGAAVFVEKRKVIKYCDGASECDVIEDKIDLIIQAITDCKAVIALRIGEVPKEKLGRKGIKVFTTYDKIETAVNSAVRCILEVS